MEARPQNGAARRSLTAIFPALQRLGRAHRRSIPVVRQATATDCAAACLAMVLGTLEHHVELSDVRSVLGVGRDGASAQAIIDAAALFQLRGQGVRVDLEDLRHLPRATILHWKFSHFVVFDRLVPGGARIVDPAFGPRTVSLAELDRSFTGVALVFEKGEKFVAQRPKRNAVHRHLRAAFVASNDWFSIAGTSIFLELVGLGLPLVHGRLIDRVIPRNDEQLLLVLLLGLAGAVVFNLAAALTRGHLLLQLRTRFDGRMTFGFIEHLLRLPCNFFERRQVADLQMRVASVATIREVLTGAILSGCIDGVMVVTHFALLLVMSSKMAAVALAIVCVQATAYVATRSKLRELAAGSIVKQAEAANALNELLQGIECLKSSGLEERAAQAWAARYVDVMNLGLRQGGLAALTQGIMSSLSSAGPLLLLVAGVVEVMSHRMSVGTMLSANALAVGFIQPLMGLVGTLQQLQAARVHLVRIDDVLGTEPEQLDHASLRLAPMLTGRVTLDRVTFSYGPKIAPAVRDVSVDIRPGECVAIVGRSGSGKTTLGRLLVGLYTPREGSIRFDGIPIGQLELRSLRRQLGVVIQKPHVFATSIRGNIALADSSIPIERVQAAAKRACVDADIDQMPMGYDTPVVAGGASLSGGQRQRIALARALVEEPRILLLDEATSALDAITEKAVQQELHSLACTRIVIAHRLSTVVNADRILVMDDGRIVEQGTHAELLARNGVYTQLVSAQMGRKRGRGRPGAEVSRAQEVTLRLVNREPVERTLVMRSAAAGVAGAALNEDTLPMGFHPSAPTRRS